MNGRFLDGPRAGSRLHSSPGGTMPTPGYVGLEVRTLPLSNLVRVCVYRRGDVRVRARALGGDLYVRRG